MRIAGLIEVPEGLDFGVIWPLYQAAKVVHTRDVRGWLLDFFNDWPLELVLVTTLRWCLYLTNISGPEVRANQLGSDVGPTG
jgi:hypothetical protein